MLAVKADIRKIPWNAILVVVIRLRTALIRQCIELRYIVKEPRDAED
jgi:hypothetical protein